MTLDKTKNVLIDFWKRYRRKKAAIFGMYLAAFFICIALLAPLIAPYDLMELSDSFESPSLIHFLGTDSLGADVLSCVIWGTRTSLMVGLCVVITSTFIGLVVGAMAGFYGSRVDDLLMRITEMFQVLPRFFLAVIFVAFYGPSIWNIVLVLGILAWPATARILRAEFLTLTKREFVEAGRALGMSNFKLIVKEVLPNALPPVIVNASLEIASAILLEASLSFLGLGDPSVMSWGTMLHNSQEYFTRGWWMAAFPGMALFLTTLGLNLVGDGLNDALNPRLRGKL